MSWFLSMGFPISAGVSHGFHGFSHGFPMGFPSQIPLPSGHLLGQDESASAIRCSRLCEVGERRVKLEHRTDRRVLFLVYIVYGLILFNCQISYDSIVIYMV